MSDLNRRKTLRLQGYDYRAEGAYFVTICTFNRELLWGNVEGETMFRSGLGDIAHDEWYDLAQRYTTVALDGFIVMPNHIHGIVVLIDDVKEKKFSLSQVVGAYKARVTSRVNTHLGVTDYKVWQRNYYERIIRNEAELERIRLYIAQNPVNWIKDEHYHH